MGRLKKYRKENEMMRKMSIVVLALCVLGLNGCKAKQNQANNGGGNAGRAQTGSVDAGTALNFRGWFVWGGLEAATAGNTVTFKGRVNTAGYVNEHLSTAMRNKRVTLEIENASRSNFSEDRMIKITVNNGDLTVCPLGMEISDLVYGEYIPPEYNRVEFDLPDNFDGKLGFVFYQADLRNLKITAYYK
jgi:hypothetical protein